MIYFQKKKAASEDEYGVDDLDLDKVIYPLGHYVKDRETLLGEIFHCVRGSSLQRNLPDVLKVGGLPVTLLHFSVFHSHFDKLMNQIRYICWKIITLKAKFCGGKCKIVLSASTCSA